MRWIFLMLLTTTLPGCDTAEVDSAFRQQVAQTYAKNGRKSPAPTAKLARELEQLCSCTEAGIRSGNIGFNDGQNLVNAKVQEAMRTCSRRVYGE